jgi:NAD(P)-dependent dehydrogenase (short-subunit alcohol dehydrogenase family)
LTIDGLVHRFDPGATLGGDQLPLDEFEGAFLPVTFWFAHALAKVGRMDQAEAILKRCEAMAGELGLFAEEIAMTGVFSPVKEMTAAEFKRVTEVTYLGFVNGTLAALKRMLPRDQGRIIQVGSALAYRGIPLQAAYCASKHAIQGFMDSLRCELIFIVRVWPRSPCLELSS